MHKHPMISTRRLVSWLAGICCLAAMLVAVTVAPASAGELTFTSGGTAPWFSQNLITHDGIDAQQSGAISHSQSSWMETTVTGPGAVRFWWKVSSESCCDPLTFSIDGTSQANIRGSIDWQNKAFAIPAGSHTLRWTYSTDSSVLTGSNAGWMDQITFEAGTFDLTPPVTSVTPAGGTVATPQTVTLSANEPATIYYTINGSEPTTSSPQYSTPLTISGTTTLKFFAVDTAGNYELTKTATYTFDTTPPSTGTSLSPGSYSGRRDVSLYCSDSGMGCAATYYCLGSGCTPATFYSSAIALTTSTDLRYFSTDRAGNSEAVKTSTFTITPDTTPPTTTPGYASGTYGPMYAYLSCSDGSGSGCNGTYYCLSAGCTPAMTYSSSIQITTSTDLRFYSQDRSGNNEAVKTVSYVIDQTPPVTTANPPGGSYETAPLVTLACSDGTGTGCSRTYYCTGASCTPSILYSTPVPINDTTVLRFYSTDNANKNEAVVTQSYTRLGQTKTITVPGMRSTIQSAIDAAYNGDTVLVAPGIYRENINFKGKAITVVSSAGADATTIDGNQAGTVVSFNSGEGLSSVLDGFTLRNGNAGWNSPNYGDGGGIYISSASPTIINNSITANTASWGGGIYAGSGSPLIQGNIISYNNSSSYGGGIIISWAGSAQIINNTISDNTSSDGGGIGMWAGGTPTVRGNSIKNNTASSRGGGISMVNGSDAMILQNVLVNNVSGTGSAAYWLTPSGYRGPFLVNNTIVDSNGSQGSVIYADGYDANALLVNNIVTATGNRTAIYCGNFNDMNPPQFSHNVVFSTTGAAYGGICTDQNGINGSITSDPQLSGPATGYLGLRPGSPAIDAGENSAPSLPANDFGGFARVGDGNNDGTALVDIGAYEFDPTGPVATLQGIPVDFLATSALDVTVGGTDVVSYRYALDGGAFSDTDTAVATAIHLTGLTNGQHSLVVLGKNALGREQLLSSATAATWVVNTETSSLIFTYGGEAPWFVQPLVSRDGIAYQSGAISNNQSSWMETTVTGPGAIRFWWKVSSDYYSDYLRFSIDGTTQSSITGEVDWQPKVYLVPAGSHTLRWNYITDSNWLSSVNAGWVDQVTFEAGSNIDVTPPATSTTPAAGMYPSNQNVTLTCSDAGGSSCAGTFYCLGSGCNPTISYNTPIAISSATDLRFYSTDTAGNSEMTKSATYTFDSTPPNTSNNLSPGTYSGRRDASLYCSDSGMGCAATYYCLGSGCSPATPYSSAIAITASTDLRYYSVDRGGNSEAVKTSTYTITPDVTAPATTANYPGGTYSTISVYLSCSDGAGSGCAGTYYCLDIGCTPTSPFSGSITIAVSTDLRFYSVDRSGNSGTISSVSYTIDRYPPITSPSIGGGIYQSFQNVTLSCSDGSGSGCSTTYYCLGAGCSPGTQYTGPISIGSSTYLSYYSRDMVSNQETAKTERYTILTAPPTTINVPADRATIQAAIDAAIDGDTVLVAPGIYVEHIDFKGKAITVTSSGGPNVTIIDGNQAGSVVTFKTREERTTVLDGFTIRNGKAGWDYPNNGDGGGIYIDYASPTIINNTITANTASWGGGIYEGFGSPLIQGNIITHNTGSSYGGGISIGGAAAAQIIDNTISDNTGSDGGGISMWGAGTPTVRGNTIKHNTASGNGGGIAMINTSEPDIIQNEIAGNHAGSGGGIYWSIPSSAHGIALVNNTIVANDATQGSGVFAGGFDANALIINNIIAAKAGQAAIHCEGGYDNSPPQLSNNAVFSSGGSPYSGICTDQNGINGNITADPQLNAPAFGYFGLLPGSPAIDAGDNSAPALPATDLNGSPRLVDGSGLGIARVDIGAYEYDPDKPRAALTGQPTGVIRETTASITVGGPGIVSYRYALDGGSFTTTDTPVDTSIVLSGLAGGTHAVAVIGKTLTREQSAASATVAGWTVDTIPPVTAATPAGGSFTGPQYVTLTCSDTAGSGCADTFYCIGSGCLPTTSYTGPIAITATAALRYYSRDAFGNQETIRTATYTFVGTISGRVIDSVTGNGVPWANVTVCDAANGLPIIYTSTDGSGNYQVDGLVSGGYKVSFTSYDYVEQWYNGKPDQSTADTVTVSAPAATAGINAIMVKGGSISGIVSASDTGAGIQYVFVAAYNAITGAWAGYGYTDSSGAYTVSGLANGTYRLRFSVDSMTGYIGQWYNNKEQFSTATNIAVTAPDTVGGINVTLGKGGTIGGRVADSVSGAGIQDVFVATYNALTGAQVGYGYTDSSGAYSITGLASGSYKLSFNATGYVIRWYDGQADQNSATAVTVSAPNTTANINVALGRGGSISGTIADRTSGAGIANVYLYVVERSSGAWAGSSVTDGNGRYTISGLASGSYRMRIDPPSAAGYPGRWYGGQDSYMCAGTISVTAPNATSSIDALLDRGGSISGRVTDAATGSGIPGVNISLRNTSTQAGIYTPIVTDSTGAYTIAGLPSGEYSLTFNVLDYIRTTSPATVRVSAPDVTSGIDISLVRGGVISGRITDRATGNGLANVLVEAVDTTTRFRVGSSISDYNGNYAITGLPGGSYAVYYDGRYTGGTYGSGWKTVPSAGAAPAAASGVTVGIITLPPPVPIFPFYPVPIDLVQPLPVDIPSSAQPVPVVAPAVTDGIDMLIDPLGAISGRVTDISTDAPLDWISVIAYDSTGSVAGSTITNPDGSYTINGVPNGSYWVRFVGFPILFGGNLATYSAVTIEVAVQAPQITSGIDARLARAGGISGLVSVSSCPAPRIINIKAYDAATGNLAGQTSIDTTNADRFTITALPPGSYKLAIIPAEAGFVRQWYLNKNEMTGADPVTVTSGTITSLGEVTLAAGGGSISGRVFGNAGCTSLPASIKLYARDSGGLVAEGRTSSDGSYQLTGLPDASYKLLFTMNQLDLWYRTPAETEQASAVVVSGGLSVTGIDLTGACPPDGICGSDNDQTLAKTAPAALCANGTPSAISGSGHPWAWTCQGDVGTEPAACSATIQTYSLSVSLPAASGKGDVQADLLSNDDPPAVLFCPASFCSALYDHGRTVRLTATPDSISLFSAWGGDCSADPCDVAMTAPKAVIAQFSRAYSYKNVTIGMLDNSLASLVSVSSAGNEIRMLATELAIGSLALDRALTLSGGWKALYLFQDTNPTTLSGTLTIKEAGSTLNDSAIKGRLIIQSGSLRVKRVLLGP